MALLLWFLQSKKSYKTHDAPLFCPIHRMRCDCVKSFRLNTPRATFSTRTRGLVVLFITIAGKQLRKNRCDCLCSGRACICAPTILKLLKWRITCVTCGLCYSKHYDSLTCVWEFAEDVHRLLSIINQKKKSEKSKNDQNFAIPHIM